MPRHRRSNDSRRLLVIHQANQRAEAEAQAAAAAATAEPERPTIPFSDDARTEKRELAVPAPFARIGQRRRASEPPPNSPPEEIASPPAAIVTTAALAEHSPAVRGLMQVRQMLESTQPATWVFTGDTIVQGGGQTGAGRTFSEHFGDHLRNKLRRLLDVVINTGVTNSRCENLLKALDWRVTRFGPDIVLALLGVTDSAAGPAGHDRFRNLLHKLVDAFESSPTTLLFQTPPTTRPDRWTDSSDLPAYVDLIREVALQRDIALIDHWSLFEERLAHADSEPDWWSAGGLLPNIRGHVELARQLVEHLASR